jgi:hypothetical protein
MLRSGTVLGALVLALATACGAEKDKGEQEAAGKECGPAPAAMAGKPKLPPRFPTPSGVRYTSDRRAGPSRIVAGFRDGDLEQAFDAYESAFGDAGYDVTKDEKEDVDAEVNFAGGSSTGQVKLVQGCKDRTTITVTIRPE